MRAEFLFRILKFVEKFFYIFFNVSFYFSFSALLNAFIGAIFNDASFWKSFFLLDDRCD